jgi:hypothetical protein
MKNIGLVAVGMVLLVSSFACAVGSMVGRTTLGLGFSGDPIPPACFPKVCTSTPRVKK